MKPQEPVEGEWMGAIWLREPGEKCVWGNIIQVHQMAVHEDGDSIVCLVCGLFIAVKPFFGPVMIEGVKRRNEERDRKNRELKGVSR